MQRTNDGQGKNFFPRMCFIGFWILSYIALASYFHIVVKQGIIYTHFAYIPIVLASMWWGRKGMLVAVLLGLFTFSFHLFGIGYCNLWDDICRVTFFLLVAFYIGILSERILRGQQELRESEEKYRLIIEKSLNGIMLYRDDSIIFANSRLCEMLGYSACELVGKNIWKLICADDIEKFREYIARTRQQKVKELSHECRFIRKDKKIIWADIASTITNDQRPPGVLIYMHDITTRKEAEKERQQLSELAREQEEQLVHSIRLAEMGEMAASIAHELNQPLTGIRNFAQNAIFMLEEDIGGEEEIKENLQFISKQVDRAAKIINQMRSLTRKSKNQFEPIDVNKTIQEIVEFLTPQLKLSQVNVILDLVSQCPTIKGDRLRIEQVFLNLITNARQAMEGAKVRGLLIKTYFNQENELKIEVADTGKGFSPAEAKKLFIPFYTTKKVGHGTGLGLSISFNIIKEHNAIIDVWGSPGEGAKFIITFPATSVEKRGEQSE